MSADSSADAAVESEAETATGRRLSVLCYTTLYPNVVQPRHGIFIEERMRQLRRRYPVDLTVVAPVPWFPSGNPRFGKYAELAQVPAEEVRDGVRVLHPRYPLIPKISMNAAAVSMALATLGCVRKLARAGRGFDVIDSHFLYADAVSATWIARRLDKPVVISARGSDVNYFTRHRIPRASILWAARRADAVVTVSRALADALQRLAPDIPAPTVLRNGVDLDRFARVDRDAARARLGIERFCLLSVGNLIELKGHHLIIEALADMPDCELVIAGHGPDAASLEQLAIARGVADRVQFAGLVPQQELKHYYSAADSLVLASSMEGWANVLLESMACGTPVVATPVGGTPEAVTTSEAGQLMTERSAAGIVRAVRALRADLPDRQATLRYIQQFSWDETIDRLHTLLLRVVDARSGS